MAIFSVLEDAAQQMARSVFSARAEYLLRVDGKVFGVLFPTLEEAEEMARTFVTRGAAKAVIARHGRSLIVKRFGGAAARADLANAICRSDGA
jgi:hypothetical protein